MFLNFWDVIRNFFKSVIENITFESIFTLFSGIIIGFGLAILVYFLMASISIKKQSEIVENDVEVNNSKCNKQIKMAIDQYKEESQEYTFTQKCSCAKDIAMQLMINIAKVYYPDSKYPLMELSVEEVLKLNSYILTKVENLFNGKILRKMRGFKIASVFKIKDKFDKFSENKVVKVVNKQKLVDKGKNILSILKIFNPSFIFKKVSQGVNTLLIDKIIIILLKIVGSETAQVYSKNIFKEDDELTVLLNDIDKELEKE